MRARQQVPQRASGRFLRVFLAELLDAAGGVEDLLLAGVERMAGGADLDLQVLGERRTGLEAVGTAAGDRDLGIRRMDFGLHGETLLRSLFLSVRRRRGFPP
jgi:hypothetical protein